MKNTIFRKSIEYLQSIVNDVNAEAWSTITALRRPARNEHSSFACYMKEKRKKKTKHVTFGSFSYSFLHEYELEALIFHAKAFPA